MRKGTLLALTAKQLKQICLQAIFIFSIISIFANNAHAQDAMEKPVTITVNEVEITKVISLLETQSKIKFVYSPTAIRSSRKISCSVTNKKLKDFLVDVFSPLNIGFRTSNGQVVLYNSSSLNVQNTAQLSGDGGTPPGNFNAGKTAVSGSVKDDKGAFLLGVSVTESGTKNTTTTNEQGAFSINTTSANPVLVFSFSGFATKEVVVGDQSFIATELSVDVKGIDEVVVVGYGRQKKVTNTGAVASIGTKELVQSPVANISNSLVGRLPGLFATQSGGEPGNDGSTIRIRGLGTFSGNTNPLILVDGIEVSNYNNIDPNEIESLTILKDASSTAVYGIRGANGVIIITTRRGKVGPAKVSYTFNQAFLSFTDQRKSMDGPDYAIGYNAGQKADAYASNSTYTPKYSPTDIELYRSGADPVFHPNHDWFAEIYRKVSHQTQHNLNVSGGSKKVRYFISGGFFDQQGLFKDFKGLVPDFDAQSTYRRYNIRSNFNFEVSDRFKILLDLSSQTEIRSGAGNVNGVERIIGDIARASPIDGPGVVDGKVVNLSTSPGANNPFASLLFPNSAGGVRRGYRNYINGLLRFDYELGFITKGLAAHGNIAVQTYNDQLITNTKVLITYTAYKLPDGTINYVPSNTEQVFGFNQAGTYNRRITAEAGLDYRRSFGNHNISALVLYNQQKTYDPTFQFLVPKGYQSYVGRLNYDYKNRYLAEFDAGYNGSENFAPGKRFGFFPAYSVGWVPTQESFFPKKSMITFLKFRASYGEVGYDQIGGNRFLYNPTSYTGYGSIYYFGNIGTNYTAYNGIREGGTGNPNVTWERSLKKDIGLDMRLLKDKISITADIFQENRDNILALPQTISSVVGLTQPSTNLGRVENKGYEGEITYSGRSRQFNYRLSANYSFARNKLIYRDEIPPTWSYQARTGQRLGQYFALICDGIYNTWDEVNDAKRPVYAGNNRIQPGDLKFRDVNGDGIVNDFDQVPVGYSNVPEKTFGISLSANYKGFDASILFQGVGNVTLYYSNYQRNAGFGGQPQAGTANYLIESWTPERYAAGLPISFPRFTLGNSPNSMGSTFYIADASYLRLKNTEIGYTVRASTLKRIGISSCRIYLNANNLITWKHVYPGIDPENTSTNDTNTEPYPLQRTVNAGLNINF